MKYIIFVSIIFIFGCQTQNNKQGNNKNDSKVQNENTPIVKSVKKVNTDGINCNAEVCIQLRNHDKLNKSFDIYMLNSVPVAGFQCDLEGINILQSKGGMLDENGYQTSNSSSRLLSFSMQAKLISIGEGVLTTINYSEPESQICMTAIIFAGTGGSKLTNNQPECLELD